MNRRFEERFARTGEQPTWAEHPTMLRLLLRDPKQTAVAVAAMRVVIQDRETPGPERRMLVALINDIDQLQEEVAEAAC